MATNKIYFAAVSYDFEQYEREDFAREQDREEWIARRANHSPYGGKVVSVARAEGEREAAAAPHVGVEKE